MDLQVIKSRLNTPEAFQRPKAMNAESTNDQAVPRKVREKIPSNIEESSTQFAGQKAQQEPTASDPEWKAGRDEWLIIIVLAIVSLMVALDATILVPVLPVSVLNACSEQ